MGLELFAMMFLVIHGGNGLARKVKVFLFCCWFWWKKFQMFRHSYDQTDERNLDTQRNPLRGKLLLHGKQCIGVQHDNPKGQGMAQP